MQELPFSQVYYIHTFSVSLEDTVLFQVRLAVVASCHQEFITFFSSPRTLDAEMRSTCTRPHFGTQQPKKLRIEEINYYICLARPIKLYQVSTEGMLCLM